MVDAEVKTTRIFHAEIEVEMPIRKGDTVVFNSKYDVPPESRFTAFTVESHPVALASGVFVMLKGKPYPADGLTVIFNGDEREKI